MSSNVIDKVNLTSPAMARAKRAVARAARGVRRSRIGIEEMHALTDGRLALRVAINGQSRTLCVFTVDEWDWK